MPAVDAADRPALLPPPGRWPALPAPLPLRHQDTTPGVLLPRAEPDDQEVIRVGELSIRKSHVYDRLFEENPQFTKLRVDALVFDVLLAQQAQKHGIFVDARMVDRLVDEEERKLVEQVERDWGQRLAFEEFLELRKGVDRKTHRLLERRNLARKLYRYYVARYLALREDRVQVRILSHSDADKVRSLRTQARDGAEFHTLALRESEHRTQAKGGLLPPLSRDSEAAYAAPAFALRPGEVSEVLSVSRDGFMHYYILYCVRHMPGRDVSFAEAKDELDRQWLQDPVTSEEETELYLRLRSTSEALNNRGVPR